jgi:hypothetical protein
MTNGEKTAVRNLLNACRLFSWFPVAVDDGGDERIRPAAGRDFMTTREVIAAVEAVDDSTIIFAHQGDGAPRRKQSARIVLGNARDGSEVVADNSIGDADFAAACDRITRA